MLSRLQKYLLLIICVCMGVVHIAFGKTIKADSDMRITVPISKSGLNRISNTPYKIEQVTGDDSKFRLKSDDDGSNIYLMPLVDVGQNIEISIKNNIGQIQDLDFVVTNVKGQTINIDSRITQRSNLSLYRSEAAQMLKAMDLRVTGKFYVQEVNILFDEVSDLEVRQTLLYRWKNIKGGVFEISNKTKSTQSMDIEAFIRRFSNVITYWGGELQLEPKSKTRIYIIQGVEEID